MKRAYDNATESKGKLAPVTERVLGENSIAENYAHSGWFPEVCCRA